MLTKAEILNRLHTGLADCNKEFESMLFNTPKVLRNNNWRNRLKQVSDMRTIFVYGIYKHYKQNEER